MKAAQGPATPMNNQPMHGADHSLLRANRRSILAVILWFLTFLFALRVLAQAVQHWTPQTWLPPFDQFQGSSLPYWLLLSAQVVILALMVRTSRRAQSGALSISRRTGRVLAWVGGIYLLGSLGRIAVGLFWSAAPAWFSTWIPALFHVVLSGFIVVLSLVHLQRYRLQGPDLTGPERQR